MSMNDFNLEDTHFVGYITEMTYDSATIMSHDYHVSKANFVPKGAFLLVQVKEQNNPKPIAHFLLRVLNISYIDQDNKSNKEKTIQKVTSHDKDIIDLQKEMNDPINQNKLSFYQLNCNLLGTFYSTDEQLYYGSDAYSFNVSHIYKVYKPTGENLEKIVNFVKMDRLKATHSLFESLTGQKELNNEPFNIGRVRYASTELENEDSKNKKIANVDIYPSDFIKQKTGIFGMTRTGKSNTVKIIAKSIMSLSENVNIPIGQLIYDINGEYANDNEQNKKLTDENLYTVDVEGLKSSDFNPALNNFYLNPSYGLNIMQEGIRSQEKGSNYINVFLSIKNIENDPILFILWIALLYKSGYKYPEVKKEESLKNIKSNGEIEYRHWINKTIIYYVHNQSFCLKVGNEIHLNYEKFLKNFFKNVNNNTININEENLAKCIKNYFKLQYDNNGKIKEHELYNIIRNAHSDNELYYFSLIGFILQEDRTTGSKMNISGWQMIVPYQYSHCNIAFNDYRLYIYDQLIQGKTVIIDFSIGDPFTRKYIADELMLYIFEEQIKKFRNKKDIEAIKVCPIINVFIEEAHNVIGKGAAIDSLWPRIAKEGAKYNIGLIYTTQEPSAIHESILANTANFIVAHLNNEKEINTISQYEDIGDFQESIRRSEDVGFVRLRLLSKPYTIPVQIKPFENGKV